MTHDPFIEKISLWLDNELSPQEITELQTHLSRCPICQQSYQAMQQVDQFLHQASTVMVSPPPGFNTRFEVRLARHNAKQGRLWLGLTVLFLGTIIFAIIGAVVGGAILMGLSSAWLNWPTLYYLLGELGGIVNQMRALINLSGLFFTVAFMAMREPLFWGYVAVTIVLAATWVRVMQLLYRRAPLPAMLFA
ncbi:MAG: zf-HC2 domain-containing protein [Anaerolineae bacterium]|nr:zf-HC2 domain-containing protein [Anaerolineae bacterium]